MSRQGTGVSLAGVYLDIRALSTLLLEAQGWGSLGEVDASEGALPDLLLQPHPTLYNRRKRAHLAR